MASKLIVFLAAITKVVADDVAEALTYTETADPSAGDVTSLLHVRHQSEIAPGTHKADTSTKPSSPAAQIWFGFAKEDMACFRPDDIAHLIGGPSSNSKRLLLTADVVALLEASRRPSSADMERDSDEVDFQIEDCLSRGGVGMDDQMRELLGANMRLLQVHQYCEDMPTTPHQALLSIWYNPKVVSPGAALAYKNKFGGDQTSCVEEGPAKMGPVDLFDDMPISLCPESLRTGWPYYGSDKSALAASLVPVNGGDPFVILGVDLPAGYHKGKNEMVQRLTRDIPLKLHVSTDRIFIFGDTQSQLLPSAWDSCGHESCMPPPAFEKQLDLSAQPWSVFPDRTAVEGGVSPCGAVNVSGGGFASNSECTKALGSLTSCRHTCMVDFLCGGIAKHRPRRNMWLDVDTKRGAGGIDILPRYFEFLPDNFVAPDGPANTGELRIPAQPNALHGGRGVCRNDGPFASKCLQNPCMSAAMMAGGEDCKVPAAQCFGHAAGTETDRIPANDPITDHAGETLVRPAVGWPVTLGFSHKMSEQVQVQMYQDRPSFPAGDRVPFVASVILTTDVSPKNPASNT